MSINSVIMTGRITKDPEIRYIPGSEKAVCDMSLAVNRSFKKDETDFFKIVVFGASAESCGKYLGKGSMIGVQGRIQNNNYRDKSDVMHYGTDIVADRVEFLDSKKKDEKTEQDPTLPLGFEDVTNLDEDDDEIPF